MCDKAKKNEKSKVDMDAMERVTRKVLAFKPDKNDGKKKKDKKPPEK